jgi:hypothetical protein
MNATLQATINSIAASQYGEMAFSMGILGLLLGVILGVLLVNKAAPRHAFLPDGASPLTAAAVILASAVVAAFGAGCGGHFLDVAYFKTAAPVVLRSDFTVSCDTPGVYLLTEGARTHPEMVLGKPVRRLASADWVSITINREEADRLQAAMLASSDADMSRRAVSLYAGPVSPRVQADW